MTVRPELEALADYCGVLRGYEDWQGRWADTPDTSRAAILAAMGLNAATEASSRRTLESLRDAEDGEPLVLVWDLRGPTIRVTTGPSAWASPGASCELVLEGTVRGQTVLPARCARTHGRIALEVAEVSAVAPGYYDGVVVQHGRERTCFVLATPGACASVVDRTGAERSIGIALNVYTLRSAVNWGVGDLGDVRRAAMTAGALVETSSGTRVGWLGLSPLHASTNRGAGVSPYFPTSRIYGNEMYLDVAEVAEVEASRAGVDRIGSADFRRRLERLRAAARLDRTAALEVKREALAIVHEEAFRSPSQSPCHAAYGAYLDREGQAIADHAIYEAIAEQEGSDWREWPEKYRDPRARTVAEFRARNERRVDYHAWIQFHLDRQRAAAGDGLTIGLMADLAVGTAPGGSEVWSDQGVFAHDVVLGAPPDDYSETGQSWGVAPMLPRALRRTRYRQLRRLLEANLRHCGALRIDHAMGLVRQFWLPLQPHDGGAYVALPAEETFAVLAIESHRADAIIVAEDLGTVPEGFRERLADHGCLRTHVMYFERTADGDYAGSVAYAAQSLATPNTHDQPPLAGYVSGVDLDRRESAGSLSSESHAAAIAERKRDVDRLMERLAEEGDLDPAADGDLALCAAALRLLARSPASLVGIGLDDLGGEEDPVNVPGLAAEQGDLWSRRMNREVDAILGQREIRRLFQEVAMIMDARRHDR